MRILIILFILFCTKINAQTSDQLKSSIDSLFSQYNNNSSPGCAIVVIDGGKKVYEGYYGMSNLEYRIPITSASKFHVASLSKQFTAAAIIKLVQEGRLSLDDDIRKFIPEVPDFGYKITIGNLLHHTSGIRDQFVMFSLAGWRDYDLVTEKDIVDIVRRQKTLNNKPGDEFMYSNTGYTLLGIAVKRITNVSLKDYADSVFFKPLDMKNTHFQSDHAAIIAGRTSAYYNENGNWKISIPVFDNYGATSLFTTVEDLAKWDNLFYTNTVEGNKFTNMMYQPGTLNDKTKQLYASGVMLTNVLGYDAIEHTGADAAYRSYFLRVPEKHFAVYLLANVDDIDIISACHKIFKMLHGAKTIESANNKTTKFQIDSSIVSKWAGNYFDSAALFIHKVNFQDGQLKIGWWGLEPISNTEFSAGPLTRFCFSTEKGDIIMTKKDKGNANQVFRKIERSDKPVPNIKQYTGKFFCSELGVYYNLELADNKIVVDVPRNEPIKFSPFQTDLFEGEYDFVIRFKRNGNKQVSGFFLSNGRARNLFFKKVMD